MLRVNHSVVNLIKLLYDNFNGRPLNLYTQFGLYFELIYSEENLVEFLNLVYYEISQLNGLEFQNLSSLEDLKKFSFSKGLLPEMDLENEVFLEESLVLLCSERLRLKNKFVKSLNISQKQQNFIDDSLLSKLKDLKISNTNYTCEPEQSGKRQLNKGLDESQVDELNRISEELSKDYNSRWNSYLDRFYNLLDVFFKVKGFKDSRDFQVLMETLKEWRKTTKFRELNLYDACTYRRDDKNVVKISYKTDNSNRVTELYSKIKSKL
ncbi:uncharacterized protein TA05655 [Theileria annulata]|uniref:Uncharacterized protein n=1 Tax=Theileria annulata TaxID=5874 RepID=Q4UHX6_THEAN|nr:uncharacterized protein TA05655 [Theileria annulata]CAI73313.1 hypothetical protein TA05655 [Theileria annulata]|eukprot:XP_953990.1 hypothetical protein TA05655 [Theileria annulata]